MHERPHQVGGHLRGAVRSGPDRVEQPTRLVEFTRVGQGSHLDRRTGLGGGEVALRGSRIHAPHRSEIGSRACRSRSYRSRPASCSPRCSTRSRHWCASSPPPRMSTPVQRSPRSPSASSRAGCRSPHASRRMAGRPVWRWGTAQPRVLLLGHLDTVWPTRLPRPAALLERRNGAARPGRVRHEGGHRAGLGGAHAGGRDRGRGRRHAAHDRRGDGVARVSRRHRRRDRARRGRARSRALGRRCPQDRAQGHVLVHRRVHGPGRSRRPRSGTRRQRTRRRGAAGGRLRRVGSRRRWGRRSPPPCFAPAPLPTRSPPRRA